MGMPRIGSGRVAHRISKKVFFVVAALSLIAAPAAAAEPPAMTIRLAHCAHATDGRRGDNRGSDGCGWRSKCGAPMGATVWYALTRPDDRTVVVSFQAHGELDVVVAAFQMVRAGLKTLVCVVSDAHGKAGFSFEGAKDATYLILVGQRANSVPGTFHLDVQAPRRPSNDDPAGAELLR